MSIDVTAPDGSSVAFPDGTPADVIKSAMARKFGGEKVAENVSRETSPSAGGPSTMEGVGRAFATGVPVVGGVLNKLDAATNALIAPLLDPYLPESFEKLPQGSFAERYEKALEIQRRKDKTFATEHPVLSVGGELAGGIGGVGGALKAAPKATSRLLGLDAATLPGQVIKGAAGGAALSTVDALTREGADPEEAAKIGAITGAAAPVVGRLVGRGIEAVRGLKRPPATPQNVVDVEGVPVRQSLGQVTGDTEAITREQMALRGADNSTEQVVARNFFDEQKAELERARAALAGRFGGGQVVAETPQDAASVIADSLAQRGNVAAQTAQSAAQRLAAERGAIHADLSPTRSVIAANPTEAAGIVSQTVGNAAERAQAATREAYGALANVEGAFHPAAFNTATTELRAALNRGSEPVKVNPQTTPIAQAALDDLDEILAGRATAPQQRGLAQTRDPVTGRVEAQPPITAQAVDEVRKRLNSFYGDALAKARSSGDRADSRAMRRMIDAFDDVVNARLRDGRFLGGDPAEVISAMDRARGMNTAYRRAFTSQGAGDEVGAAIQKIVGRFDDQAAPPEQIRTMLYGNGGLPVKIAQRLINIFGRDSTEIGAIRQGLFSHLTESPTGALLDPAKAADNVSKFLNTSTLAQVYLNPAERQRWSSYADALRRSVPAERSDIDRIVAKIGGAAGETPASTTDVVNWLMTTKGVGRTVSLAQRIKTEFGADSREWSALKQGIWSKLNESSGGPLDVGSRKIVNALTDFLEKDGKPLSHVIFAPEERELIKAYRDLLDRITPPSGTVNYSNTSTVLSKMLRGTLDGIFGIGGLHLAGPVGMAAGIGAHVAQKAIGDAVKATKVARSLYGTPQEAVGVSQLRDSLARLSSVAARGATPALAQ